jgi:hypothetical protein
MYLSTTVDRSMTYRSRPRSAATTSADRVLPVPDSPANSAVTPWPFATRRPSPPAVQHELAVPHPGGQLPQLLRHGRGQHEVLPAHPGLDSTGQSCEGILLAHTRLLVSSAAVGVVGSRGGRVAGGSCPPAGVAVKVYGQAS